MRADRRLLALLMAAPTLSVSLALLPSGSVATAASGPSRGGHAVQVQYAREMPTAEVGVPRPRGVAWSPRLQGLVVASAGRVALMDPSGRRLPAARVDLAPRALERARPAVLGERLGLPARSVRGAAYDGSGGVVLLSGTTLVRQGRDGRVTRTPVQGATGHALRGLTRWAGRRGLFTYDRDSRTLLGVSRRGRVVERYDLRAVGVRNVTGIAVAPSADATDSPLTASVYLADAGDRTRAGRVVETSVASTTIAAAATNGSVVRSVKTSTYSPPSPDPSGIAYLPDLDRMVIGDGEVDEMSIFRGVNLFETTRAGMQTRNGVSQPWSDEPCGVGYNTANHHLLVSDDDDREVYDVTAGADGRYGSPDDTIIHFDTAVAGNNDTEDVDYDPVTGSVWTIDGVNKEVYRYRPGADGRFGTSDDVRSHFDVAAYGAQDPEGIAYDPVRDTLVVIDDKSDRIYELDRTGALLNTISTSAANMLNAAGVTVAPGSLDASVRNYYAVARGVDNNDDPAENDGMLYEISAAAPPIGNQPPVVDAGVDLTVVLPASATLDGTVTDDGLPSSGALSSTWSQMSGPGTVTFADTSAVDTTATFSTEGTYVLRLRASDGELTGADDVTVVVLPVGSPVAVETAVVVGSDDAEQSSSGSVSLTSSDLELVTDGSTVQTVGVRFAGLQVPPGATVTRAWVQFETDEVSTDVASLTLRAEAADNTPTYQATSGNLTSRTLTSASVAWTPPAWNVVGERSTAQRTPDLSPLVQAVVGRPGWVQGYALAVQIKGSGRRTAEAFDGTFAPVLHVEFSTGGTPSNRPPSVDAGPDRTVLLPGEASLDGSITDDGLPSPPSLTTTWSKASGPGTVSFASPGSVDTTASFSSAGSYVLRLTASDSELTAFDDVSVTVQDSGTVQVFEVPVGAGAGDAEQRDNGSVQLTSGDLDMFLDHTQVMSAIGLRFTGIALPPGAVVSSAYVQFTADEVGTGAASMAVRAQAADNAPDLVASTNNLSGRAVTVASAAWAPPDWTTVGRAGPEQRTGDLAAVLQEVVSRPGWASGNAVVLLLTGSGQRTADSFEGGHAPRLHIEWHL